MLALEPFFVELISGVESELSERSIALTIQLVHTVEKEMAVYRRWWAERRVDGVLMVDLRNDDPRIAELHELGLPAVVGGGPMTTTVSRPPGTTRRRSSPTSSDIWPSSGIRGSPASQASVSSCTRRRAPPRFAT